MELSEQRTKWLAGTAAFVAVTAVGAWMWWPRTSAPGKAPAVPSADRREEVEALDGMVVPAMTAEQVQQLQQGQTVNLKVGEGNIQFSTVKPEGQP